MINIDALRETQRLDKRSIRYSKWAIAVSLFSLIASTISAILTYYPEKVIKLIQYFNQ